MLKEAQILLEIIFQLTNAGKIYKFGLFPNT